MKLLAFIIFVFCGSVSATAQQTIKEIIGNMPESIIPYINDDQRAELQKFTGEKDTVKIKNVFNGTTSIDTISSNFAKISMSKVADMQLRLLPTSDSTQIICTIKTVNSPLKESSIRFYSTDWQPINSTFGLPENTDADSLINMFVQKPDTITEEKLTEFTKLRNYIEPVIIYADFKSKDNIITFNLSIPFVPKDKLNELKAITKKISFKWDGQNFKKC